MTIVDFARHSPESTEASLSVLLRLAEELVPLADSYRVVGGMAAYLLCREHADLGAHVGSFDVDLVFDPKTLPAKPPLADRLRTAELRPSNEDPTSMYWFADKLPVDILAPRPTEQSPGETDLAAIRAWCPPGTAAVLENPKHVRRGGKAWMKGFVQDVTIPVANGPSIVMAKARAFRDRAYGHGREVDEAKAAKHAYDLFYLMTSYGEGPAGLVDQWRKLAFAPLKQTTLEILDEEFQAPSSKGATLAGGFIRANFGQVEKLEAMVSEQVGLFIRSVRR